MKEMNRLLSFFLCFFFVNLFSDNYTVGYQAKVSSPNNFDVAVLWITDSNKNTTTTHLDSSMAAESKALSIAQVNNYLYITGYITSSSSQHACLWTYDLKSKTVAQTTLDTLDNASCANGIVAIGTTLYAAGYLESNNKKFLTIWKISTDPLQVTKLDITNFLSTNQSFATSVIAYQQKLYCSMAFYPDDREDSQAGIYMYDLQDPDNDYICFLTSNDSKTGQANSLVISPDRQSIYIAGKAGTGVAAGWQAQFKTQSRIVVPVQTHFLDLESVSSEAYDVTCVGNNIYFAGKSPGVQQPLPTIWQTQDLKTATSIKDTNSDFSGLFQFIKPTLTKGKPDYPIYAGGRESIQTSPYAIASYAMYISFPADQLKSDSKAFANNMTKLQATPPYYQGTACDMLVDVRMPSNNIPLLLKIHKINSMQKGLNR